MLYFWYPLFFLICCIHWTCFRIISMNSSKSSFPFPFTSYSMTRLSTCRLIRGEMRENADQLPTPLMGHQSLQSRAIMIIIFNDVITNVIAMYRDVLVTLIWGSCRSDQRIDRMASAFLGSVIVCDCFLNDQQHQDHHYAHHNHQHLDHLQKIIMCNCPPHPQLGSGPLSASLAEAL